jgi:8-amino-7-oxononanoate synthase
MIDDAHGLGVLGADGAGSIAEAGLSQDDVPVMMATLGKALGVAGAFVAGSATLIDALVQDARTFVYATALPPALAAAARAAVDVARFEGWRRDRLARLVAHFRAGAGAQGWQLADSRTPIQPIVIGASDAALGVSAALEDAGFHVPAIRPCPKARRGFASRCPRCIPKAMSIACSTRSARSARASPVTEAECTSKPPASGRTSS